MSDAAAGGRSVGRVRSAPDASHCAAGGSDSGSAVEWRLSVDASTTTGLCATHSLALLLPPPSASAMGMAMHRPTSYDGFWLSGSAVWADGLNAEDKKTKRESEEKPAGSSASTCDQRESMRKEGTEEQAAPSPSLQLIGAAIHPFIHPFIERQCVDAAQRWIGVSDQRHQRLCPCQ